MVIETKTETEQGEIKNIPATEYHSILALSQSGMKDLAVSPLRYWHLRINPEALIREPSAEQKFGTALHTLVLEGEEAFLAQYAPMISEGDYPDCLDTIEELRSWLRDKGQTPKRTRKAELVQQVQTVDPDAQIWDVLKAQHQTDCGGKTLWKKEDWNRLLGAATAIKNEPAIQSILREGQAEVSLFSRDAETGVPRKARLDWVSNDCILDLKTFTQKRGKSIDESVADAIFYECYYRQAEFYVKLARQVLGKRLRFVMVFVESDAPHEVRIKELRPQTHGVSNVYWQRAEIERKRLTNLWAECMEQFGEKPWRTERAIEPLVDEDIRQFAWQ